MTTTGGTEPCLVLILAFIIVMEFLLGGTKP